MFQSEALQILQMGHNVLITGAAGSGKTTLLNEFTQWARQQGKSVAVTATTEILIVFLCKERTCYVSIRGITNFTDGA